MFSIHSSRKDCWSRERISETGLPTPVIWATVLSLVADMKPAGVPSSELNLFEPMIPRIAPVLCREYSDLVDLGIEALECLECLESLECLECFECLTLNEQQTLGLRLSKFHIFYVNIF